MSTSNAKRSSLSSACSPDDASVTANPSSDEAFGDHGAQGVFVVDEQQMDGFGQTGMSLGRRQYPDTNRS